jgi:uncharacterized membrane protein (DUF2068 family)
VRGLSPRPAAPALGLAAGLLAALGSLVLAYAVLLAILLLSAVEPSRAAAGVGTAILLLAYGAFLLVAAVGIWQGRRWSRAPAMAISLIQLPVAVTFLSSPAWWLGLALMAVSVTVIYCLLLKSSTAVFVPSASG